ncbi:MAG: OmpH family outer membrane protein [Crocinitomicaceae bacterium]|jgi:outer membrane protein|nr:OmpH family outer membrane protein [Crocinitomicaceae bacterium]
MKKVLLALLVVFGATSLMAQQKFGHVNSQELLDSLPSRKAAIKKLQEFEAAGYAELQEMDSDLQRAYAKYQKDLPTMSPVIQKIEEEKLMKKQQALQEREQSLQIELQAYNQELNAPILDRVQRAVKIVAERKKLAYVLDETTTLYFAGGTDLTAEVMVELMRLDKEEAKM